MRRVTLAGLPLLAPLALLSCAGDGAPAIDAPPPRYAVRDADAGLAFVDLAPRGERSRDRALEPDAPGFEFFQLNHVLSTGQSLSVGAAGSPPLSLAQPFANRMFSTGVIAGGSGLTALAPLVEAKVETMSSGLANLVTRLARDAVFKGRPPPRDSHDLLVSCHGVGGQPYAALKKGTAPYANGIAQLKAAIAIAAGLGQSYAVRVVTVVHGESDHVAGNKAYGADLAAWQADYEADVQALTGRKQPLPLLHTQMSSWTRYNSATSTIPLQQLEASVASGGKIVMVGPKYFLAYAADGVHLSNHGYRHMGEYHAKVYRRVVLERRSWEPLRPLGVSRSGAKITVKLHVPVPPLVLDTTLVSDPGKYGFEFADGSAAPPKISSVALAGADSVEVLLEKAPAGAKPEIRYAYRGTVGANAGPKSGPRGNLRDSDATPSPNGYPLHNWAVHFAEPVP